MDQISFRDAGLAFNMPFPPLFDKKRQVELILAVDASDGLFKEGPTSLASAIDWGRHNGVFKSDWKNWRESKGVSEKPGWPTKKRDNDPPEPQLLEFTTCDDRELCILYIPICDRHFSFPTRTQLAPDEEHVEMLQAVVDKQAKRAIAKWKEWEESRKK
jgi:hypothetical protein